jgi:hypothetical protein
MGCSRTRRSANASALAEDGSSHWTSSIASETGPSAARTCSALRTATPSVRGSAPSAPSSTRSATSSARRLGAGSTGSTLSSTSSNRSPRPAWGSPRSASEGRAERTRSPRARAASTPASQSVDFPIPASPSSTSAAGPSAAWSRKPYTEPSSSSLPMISPDMPSQQSWQSEVLTSRSGPSRQRSPVFAGASSRADDGLRTRDLRLGKPTLYQLSYVRVCP